MGYSERVFTGVALLLTVSISQAQVPEKLLVCTELTIAIERLSCFDREIANLRTHAAPASSNEAGDSLPEVRTEVESTVPVEQAVDIVSAPAAITAPAPDSRSNAGLAVTADTKSAATATPSVTAAAVTSVAEAPVERADAVDNVGAETLASTDAQTDLDVPVGEFGRETPPSPPETVREITSVITEISERTRGEHVVTLENGQVWQENFASRYFGVEPGDQVTIRKRRFGGYRLVAPSGKGYGVKRVR